MNETVTSVRDIQQLSREEAIRLARTDCERLIAELRVLRDDEWSKPTDCDRWTVKDVVAHLVGMCEDLQSMRAMMSSQRQGKAIAKEEGLSNFDGWTELQVRKQRHLSPAQTLSAYESAAPRLLRRRSSVNPLVRLIRFPSPPHGWMSMGYLVDDILTRDTWMHRADIAKATGRSMMLTREHDGRFVANIVSELARRYKGPFSLELTGEAGGSYVHGEGGDVVRMDAVDFCRVLSGRGSTGHPMHNVVPF